MDVVKTERLVACFTIKMNVPVVMVAGTIVGTKLIVEETTAIFKRMNNIVFEEEREYLGGGAVLRYAQRRGGHPMRG